MKNFFKKLSFVLAIAMVLTSLAPATASAAAKNYVAVNGKKATATYAYIGGKEVVLTPYVNGKKATKVTIENSNPEKATIDNNGVITPVANGNTIVTFKKGDKKIGTVTVKVRTRAKALNIYDRAEYKAGKKEKLSEVTLKVGEKKDLQITMPLYKVSKKAGAVKSSYFTYAEVDGTAVKVTKNAGQRNFTVEAVEAGTAKVTIVANQKTEKNVRADKYYKEASFDVTVKDEKLEAKQVGRNSIEVTGADLTEKVEDYVVKRGNTTVALASATLSEDKKSVKLVASSKNLVAGDYKVTFNEITADFTVEASKVTEIKFTADVAVLKKGVTSQASVGYKVLNQFGEDAGVTRDELAITTSCDGDGLTVKPGTLGTIVFGKTAGFVVGLDKVVATIVYTKTGVNASATLDIAAEAKPSTVELLGFYKTKGTEYAATELAEGSFNGTAHYFVVNVKDQYGNAVKAADINTSNLKINFAAPLVGINLKETGLVDVTVNSAFVGVGYPVSEGAISGSGEISVVAVVLTSGNTASATYTVAAAKTVVSFDNLAATDGLYVDKATEFTFTALDADGNEVTDYTTLNDQVKFTGSTGISFSFAKQADGSAKLYGTPSTKNPVAVVNTTKKITYKTFILTANDVRVPNAVTSVSKDAFLGAVSGETIEVPLKYINIEDQYGNPMTTNEVIAAVSGGAYSICVATDAAVAAFDVTVGVVAASGNALAATDTIIESDTAGKGTQSISVYLMKDGKKIESSECTVVLRSFTVDDLSNFEVADLGLAQAGTTKTLTVYGHADGVKVKLPSSAYTITKGSTPSAGVVSIKAVDATDKETEYTTDYQVTIDNKLGSVVDFKVNSSEKDPVPTTATLKATAKIANNTAVNAEAILGNLEVKDQYGNVLSASTLAAKTLITVSNYTATSTLTKNGTAAISYTDADTVAHFKFVFEGGYTAEFDISVY